MLCSTLTGSKGRQLPDADPVLPSSPNTPNAYSPGVTFVVVLVLVPLLVAVVVLVCGWGGGWRVGGRVGGSGVERQFRGKMGRALLAHAL